MRWTTGDRGNVQDGDLPVVPLGQPGSAPIEASTPTPIPTPPANWEIWWDLFFGN